MSALPITVIIPARNRAHLIGITIASAQAQQPAPDEIIVIDDGSTDGTKEVAHSMGVRVICHDVAEGPGSARNTGIAGARNDWIAFLDSDDVWFSGHLDALWQTKEKAARNGKYIAFVANAGLIFSGNKTPVFFGYPGPHVRRYLRPEDAFLGGNSFTTSGVMVNRTAIVEAGGFGMRDLCEDLDTWIRLLGVGEGIANPFVSFGYRKHDDNVSSDKGAIYNASCSVVSAHAQSERNSTVLLRGLDMTYTWSPFRRLDLRSALSDIAYTVVHPRLMRPLLQLARIRRATPGVNAAGANLDRAVEWEQHNSAQLQDSELSA